MKSYGVKRRLEIIGNMIWTRFYIPAAKMRCSISSFLTK